jgi:hypothetical protein
MHEFSPLIEAASLRTAAGKTLFAIERSIGVCGVPSVKGGQLHARAAATVMCVTLQRLSEQPLEPTSFGHPDVHSQCAFKLISQDAEGGAELTQTTGARF